MANLFTTYQAAETLGVHNSRIRQLILNGSLPATKLGRDWVIEEHDLNKVANRRKPGRPKTPQARQREPKGGDPARLPVGKFSGGK